MALDINGYNAIFKAFADFAQAKVNAGQNKAIARASADVQTGALAGRNITPAKRAVIYAAYDLFTKQAQNAQEAFDQVQSGSEHRTQIESYNSATFLARLLRNFDKLEAMHNKGTLTARNVLDKFFPDITDKGGDGGFGFSFPTARASSRTVRTRITSRPSSTSRFRKKSCSV